MIDASAEQGWLATSLRLMLLMQMIIQARWLTDSPLTTLPHIEPHHLYLFENKHELATLPGLMQASYKKLADILIGELVEGQIDQVYIFITLLVYCLSVIQNVKNDFLPSIYLLNH